MPSEHKPIVSQLSAVEYLRFETHLAHMLSGNLPAMSRQSLLFFGSPRRSLRAHRFRKRRFAASRTTFAARSAAWAVAVNSSDSSVGNSSDSSVGGLTCGESRGR